MGDIAVAVRTLLRKRFLVIVTILASELGYLIYKADPGAGPFGLIAAANCLLLAVWSRGGIGLPLVPLLAIQNLLAYALPIASHNETIVPYSPAVLTAAGWEVFAFSAAIAAGWKMGMYSISPSSPFSYGLQGLDDGSPKLRRMATIMTASTTVYTLAASLGVLEPVLQILPTGSDSLLHVLIAAMSACGFFLSAMLIGKGSLPRSAQVAFWLMLCLQCYIAASAFLLSTTITVVFSAIIGLFWGSGRIPWRFALTVVAILSFFNLGKFSMRDRYWLKGEGNPTPEFAFAEMPRYYREWIEVSWEALTTGGITTSAQTSAYDSLGERELEKESGQSLLDRINNLQNLLYVVDVMQKSHIEPLGGRTYSLIGPLLVPRIIWPNKPRSHEGQILLNVHFGRQALESTYTTYIAWGLLPEAYGNFGPIAGGLVLGVFLGFGSAWVEKFTARKLVLSTEGFLAFTIFLGMANSFEMVASVLITSLFQACIPIAFACAPFVRRTSSLSTPHN